MENEDVIREQMEDTRTAMSEKLEQLEQKVVDTVESTTSAVTDTVEAVKDTVKDTTDAVTETVAQVQETVSDTVATVTDSVKGGLASVKNFFDIRQNPWIGMGGSVLAGFVVAKFVFPPRRDPIQGLVSGGGATMTTVPPSAAAAAPAPRPHVASKNGGSHREKPSQSRGLFSGLTDQLTPEINKLKGMALGMLLDVSRDVVTQAVPQQWKEQVMGLFHGLASKLHATPESLQEGDEGQSSRSSFQEREDHGNRPDMERTAQRHGKRGRFDR